MSAYFLEEANRFSNKEILDLLGSVPMSSKVPIRFDRSPNYFVFEDNLKSLSAHHLLARDGHKLVGFLHSDVLPLMGLKNLYEPILCLGNLKVHPQYQRKKIAQSLISKMAELGVLRGYGGAYCLVNEGNQAMLELTKTMFANSNFSLSNHELGFLHTNSILFYGKKKTIDNNQLVYDVATLVDLDEIIDLYNQVHGHCFLAHKVDRAFFENLFSSSLNLGIEHFRVLRDQTNKIVAFTLIWDQSPFKKLYVDRYTFLLNILRAFIYTGSYLRQCKQPPSAHQPWKFFEATYLTVKAHEPGLYGCFLKHIYNEFVGSDFHFFNMSMTNPKNHSFLKSFIYQTTKTHILYFHLKKRAPLTNVIGKLRVYVDTWFI